MALSTAKIEIEWHKSLDELDGVWGDADVSDTYLVKNCHTLHRKQLSSLTREEIRLCLSQKIGVRWILPLAINILLQEPLACGDMYEGDILSNALRLPQQEWERNEILQPVLNNVASSLLQFLNRNDEQWDVIFNAYDQFCALKKSD